MPAEYSTIKVRKHVREQASAIQNLLRDRGLQSLPACMKDLFTKGITQGAVVEAALLALREQLAEPPSTAK